MATLRVAFLKDRIACRPGWILTHCVAEDVLELRCSCIHLLSAESIRVSVLAVLRTEPRASSEPGEHSSTTELHTPDLKIALKTFTLWGTYF